MRPNIFLALVSLSFPLTAACRLPLASKTLVTGVAAARSDSWDEAVRQWKKVLDLDPDSAAARNNLAVAYEKQGAFEEARKAYEAALRLDPGNAVIKDNFERFKARLEAWRERAVKPRAFIIAAVLLEAAACFSRPPVPVKMEMPGVSAFPPGLFNEIIVTDFRDDAPSPDFALGRELQGYLAVELGRSFKGTVSRMDLFRDGKAAAEDPAFWKQAAAGRERAVFLTGSAGLVGQIRKALEKKKLPTDGPFNIDRRGLIEQRRWTLSVGLSVVSATTGEALYKKAFREERDYIDLDKPAEFAFAELADRIRARLFPVLFGAPTIEERTLLRR